MLVYTQHKLKHNGVCTSMVFEGIRRKMHQNSLANLQSGYNNFSFANDYVELASRQFEFDLKNSGAKWISPSVSKKIADKCKCLAYFSKDRKFISKKTGEYKMKVAFITLTAPAQFTYDQIERAFDRFKEYLHRTANCEYVYKKELGEESKHLHYHILVNNFIPYYIVNWKWSRLLLAESSDGMYDENGKLKKSSTRIELPRSRKAISGYISKYMSKLCMFDKSVGALWGCSKNLKNIDYPCLVEHDITNEEFDFLYNKNKTIRKDYMTFVCVDPLSLGKSCPNIYAVFRPFFDQMQELLTHEQRFKFVEAQFN